MKISKVVVIGSGTMGSGIAAQVANAGLKVHLLDLTIDIANKACERIKKSRPPLLMEDNNLNHIIPGSIENDMETLKDADWAETKAVENYLSKAEKLKQPVYAEVHGAYKQEADTNVILVDSIQNITEAKSCHLNDLF